MNLGETIGEMIGEDGRASSPFNGVPFSSSWKLSEGQYISTDLTQMLPNIIFPRPQVESNSDSYYRNAYPGMKWEIPISVQGGSYPFKYEIIQGPVGMTIGDTLTVSVDQQIASNDYGVLSWVNPIGTSESITIRVTDQNNNTSEVSWTLNIGTTAFHFFDSILGNDTTGDGSFANPYKTFVTPIMINETSAGKIAVFLAGSYPIHDGVLDINGRYNKATITSASHPKSYIAHPNSFNVLFDMSQASVSLQSDDCFIGGIHFNGFRKWLKNSREVQLATFDRYTFYDCRWSNNKLGGGLWETAVDFIINDWFYTDDVEGISYKVLSDHTSGVLADDLANQLVSPTSWDIDWVPSTSYSIGDFINDPTDNNKGYRCDVNHVSSSGVFGDDIAYWTILPSGDIGDDNPSCIWANAIGLSRRNYVSIARCIVSSTSEAAMYQGGYINDFVIEHCNTEQTRMPKSNGNHFIKLKYVHTNSSIRSNSAILFDNTSLNVALYVNGLSTGTGDTSENVECCYNVGYTEGDAVASEYTVFGSISGDVKNIWTYRNTQISTQARGIWSLSSLLNLPEKVHMYNNTAYGPTADLGGNDPTKVDDIDNFTTVILGTDINTEGKLIGSARDTHLGIRGYEIGLPSWQLVEGHFISTNTTGMLPTITYPRPDTETTVDAYCRNAYPGMKWEIPIVVQGGSWPFFYELVQGPSGMSIGSTLDLVGDHQEVGENYGVLSWDNPTGTSELITIRVIDQDGNITTVDFTLAIDSTRFIFIDEIAGNDANAGDINNPLQTFTNGLWKNSNTDLSYAGKIAVFRTGTYTPDSDGLGTEVQVDATYKPRTFIGYPNESITFDMTATGIASKCTDFFISGITLDDYKKGINNWRAIRINDNATDNERQTVFKCVFTNMDATDQVAGGTDNPGCIICWGLGSSTIENRRKYISIVRCTSGIGTVIQLLCAFDCNYIVAEHNNADGRTLSHTYGGNAKAFMKFKDQCSNATMRRNSAVGTIGGDGSVVFGVATQDYDSDNVECCWNVITHTSSRPVDDTIRWNVQSNADGQNQHNFRNTTLTVIGDGIAFFSNTSGEKVQLESDIVVADNTPVVGTEGVTYDDNGNLINVLEDDDFDSNGNLVNGGTNLTARDDYLGTYGYEVA